MKARAAISLLFACGFTQAAQATTIGFWRLDEAGAAAGGTVGTVLNAANPGMIDGAGVNGAVFSADVPGPYIYDPVSGLYHANQFSLNAGAVNARVSVANNALLDVGAGGFTVEMFIKLVGEPVGYDTFMSRLANGPIADSSTSSDRHGWQLDIDSGTTRVNGYGRARTRFDLPGTPPSDFNRVASLNNPLLFVDTNTGSGNPNDYTAAPADPQLDGDGINDLTGWRHFAMTYNDATRQFRIYLDGVAGGLVTLNAVYTHPAASLDFGKFSANAYGLLVDEVRYSSGILAPPQFLQVSVVPEPGTGALAALGLVLLRKRVLRR